MPKGAERTLTLRFGAKNSYGQIIEYLHQHPTEARFLAMSILESRFLPFIKDPNDSDFQEIATICANTCESWAKTIREYAGLNKGVEKTMTPAINEHPIDVKKDIKPDSSNTTDEPKEPPKAEETTEKEESTPKTSFGLKFISDIGIY